MNSRFIGIAETTLYNAITRSGLNVEVMKCLFAAEQLKTERELKFAKQQAEYYQRIANIERTNNGKR